MDLSHGETLSRGSDSASASKSPSEEMADSGMQGPGGASGDSTAQRAMAAAAAAAAAAGPGDFGGAFSFFLKRTSQLEGEGGPASSTQFSAMLRELRSGEGGRQVAALAELSEHLSFSSEESLISFPMETFIPVLVGLLENPGTGDEMTAQVMLLACRCLFNIVDILPPTSRIIAASGGLPALCANLLNIEYIDVAELTVAIIEAISDDQPIQVLKAGGLQAILSFLDFFQLSVQRQAANAAAQMLLPVTPPDVLQQYVRPVLPTLATLLQHTDPQVQQSICECWRRLVDNTVVVHTKPKSVWSQGSAHHSLARLVAKGKWRPERLARKPPSPRDEGDGGKDSDPALGPVGPVLEEMCANGVLSNMLLMLSQAVSSPTANSSVVVNEVLYILSVLSHYSDVVTDDLLQQDICNLLRQMVLGIDLTEGQSSSQRTTGILKVLSLVASLLPTVKMKGASCESEEKRLALFGVNPVHLDALADAFLPILVGIFEASMDTSVQSLCVNLLLAFLLTCRERPELIQRNLQPAQLACFLANLLFDGSSRSTTLACVLMVHELLDKHKEPYALLFVRHGVVRAIHRLVTHEEEPKKKQKNRNKVKGGSNKASSAAPSSGGSAAAASSQPGSGDTDRTSTSRLVEEAAHKVLSAYFASSSLTGESAILRALGIIAEQLASSPTAIIGAHREALCQLHELLLASEGITTFELTCSGTTGALHTFLFPQAADPIADTSKTLSDRLRLFLDCLAKPESGAFVKLIRLCVSAVQRIEHKSPTLFQSQSTSSSLPPHLQPLGKDPSSSRAESFMRTELGLSGLGDLPPGFGARAAAMLAMAGGGHMQEVGGGGTSALLSVLRLLAKPVRVRICPHGAPVSPVRSISSGAAGNLSNLRALLGPLSGGGKGGDAAEAAALEATAALQLGGGLGEDLTSPISAVSPAARLRNYLASKVSRKRSVPSAGIWPNSNEKRGGGGKGSSEDTGSGRKGGGGWGKGGPDGSSSGGVPADLAALHRTTSGPGCPQDAEGLRERHRELLGEVLEAVLLVEPFAQVAALEDYIWDKHGRGGDGTPGESQPGSARLRLSMKQSQPKEKAESREGESSAASPRSPESGAGPSRAAEGAATAGAAASQEAGPKKKVRIYLNGHLLSPKTSVVQALVHCSKAARKPSHSHEEKPDTGKGSGRSRAERLLATEEGSGSEDSGPELFSAFGGPQPSPRHFCSAIWGRVHSLTYEVVDESAAAPEAETKEEADADLKQRQGLFVPSDFARLVRCHGQVLEQFLGFGAGPPSAGDGEDEAGKDTGRVKEGASESAKPGKGDLQALETMLQLISAFKHLCRYLQGTSALMVEDDLFHCSSLTAMLLQQLSDPLAVCTGSVPPWFTKLAGACQFLFPQSARRILHHSCNLGLGRALQHLQQRALAQHAHSPEALRRLESEVTVASIPRQKVRISRQRILESAIKVMNLYGSASAILEVEYVGEVGTGSGPTLEFYAQVSEILRTSEPKLFRSGVPGAMLFPEPRNPEWLQKKEDQAAQQILERFRLLGHCVAKCILDSRLVDLQLHPYFWRAILCRDLFTQQSIQDVDPELANSMARLREMDDAALSSLCVDFTLPGHPEIHLVPGGAALTLSKANVEDYVNAVAEATLVKAIGPQVAAFAGAFRELMPLEACHIWSEKELSSLIVGASVNEGAFWVVEHLSSSIKAQHGYTADSRCFQDLLQTMATFSPEERRSFLTFTTGAPTLPVGGFAGLKPSLTVVKKEAPPPPLSPDNFMPSVMTCANYLKLPEYSTAEILREKLRMAMREGQSAFLLS